MKPLKLLMGCLISAVLSLGPAGPSRRRLRLNGLTDGNHPNGKPGHLRADAILTTRYLLVKRGSDADHFALNGAADKPLGICFDEPSAIEDPAAVGLLGSMTGTVPVVGAEVIAVDADVFTAANGKVQDLPTVAGTYWRVGRAFTASAGDGDTFRIVPCLPKKTVVIANASTLGATQAAMVDGADVVVLGA